MTVFFLIVMAICLAGIRPVPRDEFNIGYLSPTDTEWIKGLFTLLIFISHFSKFIPCDSILDHHYIVLKLKMDQLVVSPFLFLSGYGVFVSIAEKPGYVKKMPMNRIWKTAFQYHAALLLFLIYQLLQGNRYSFCQLFQAFISWKGIGNSDWYVFVILLFYCITFFSFCVFRNGTDSALFLQGILSVVLLVFLRYTKCEDYWWYDTLFAYPAGMYFARYKADIDKKVMNSTVSWFITLLASFICFLVLYRYRVRVAVREVMAVLFPWIILLFGMKIRIKSSILDYFSRHLFSIFILQRLPMMALKGKACAANEFLYFVLCFVITIGLSWGFDKMVPQIWKRMPCLVQKRQNGLILK